MLSEMLKTPMILLTTHFYKLLCNKAKSAIKIDHWLMHAIDYLASKHKNILK